MSDVQELRESFLNAFPAAALLLWQDRIVAVNGAVRRRLPQLEPGEPIPPELLALSGEGGGLVTLGGAAWRVQLTETKWGRLAVLISAPQPALTDPQLDGALRQMRTYLAQMQLAAADIPPASQGMFWKSYYQLFRLTDNLDLLRQLGQPGTRDFHPAAMDLARPVPQGGGRLRRSFGGGGRRPDLSQRPVLPAHPRGLRAAGARAAGADRQRSPVDRPGAIDPVPAAAGHPSRGHRGPGVGPTPPAAGRSAGA